MSHRIRQWLTTNWPEADQWWRVTSIRSQDKTLTPAMDNSIPNPGVLVNITKDKVDIYQAAVILWIPQFGTESQILKGESHNSA